MADSLEGRKHCQICHQLRAEENIIVLKYRLARHPEVEAVVRYCKDKPECVEGAKAKAAGGGAQGTL